MPRRTRPRVRQSLVGLVPEFGDEAIDFHFEKRQVVLDDISNELEIDAPIAVNKAIPESDNLLPGRLRTVTRRGRDSASGFADDFEVSNDCILDESLPHEDFATIGNVRPDSGDGVNNVPEIWKIALHKRRASDSTYGLKCGLRLRSITTSTRRDRTLSSSSTNAK